MTHILVQPKAGASRPDKEPEQTGANFGRHLQQPVVGEDLGQLKIGAQLGRHFHEVPAGQIQRGILLGGQQIVDVVSHVHGHELLVAQLFPPHLDAEVAIVFSEKLEGPALLSRPVASQAGEHHGLSGPSIVAKKLFDRDLRSSFYRQHVGHGEGFDEPLRSPGPGFLEAA